jgi:hypothetical protein
MSAHSTATAVVSSAEDVLPLREQYRQEMNCQIVHDSIHRRAGWTTTYLLDMGGVTAGSGSMAIGGPWTEKPMVFEMYVAPEYRSRAFDLFEAPLPVSAARFLEIQSNDALLSVMLHTYAGNIRSEAIVCHDRSTTTLPSLGTFQPRAAARPTSPRARPCRKPASCRTPAF